MGKRIISSKHSRKKILEYWRNKKPELFERSTSWMIHDDNEYDDRTNITTSTKWDGSICFACGFSHGIERAHIVPISDGGEDELDNIHLLCKTHHKITEAISSFEYGGRAMYDMYIMSTPHYRERLDKCMREAVEIYTKTLK